VNVLDRRPYKAGLSFLLFVANLHAPKYSIYYHQKTDVSNSVNVSLNFWFILCSKFACNLQILQLYHWVKVLVLGRQFYISSQAHVKNVCYLYTI